MTTYDIHSTPAVYRATLPDGTEVTRKTRRGYTHIVAAKDKLSRYCATDAEACPDWTVTNWCGNLTNAEKQAAHMRNIFASVQIIPCELD